MLSNQLIVLQFLTGWALCHPVSQVGTNTTTPITVAPIHNTFSSAPTGIPPHPLGSSIPSPSPTVANQIPPSSAIPAATPAIGFITTTSTSNPTSSESAKETFVPMSVYMKGTWPSNFNPIYHPPKTTGTSFTMVTFTWTENWGRGGRMPGSVYTTTATHYKGVI